MLKSFIRWITAKDIEEMHDEAVKEVLKYYSIRDGVKYE